MKRNIPPSSGSSEEDKTSLKKPKKENTGKRKSTEAEITESIDGSKKRVTNCDGEVEASSPEVKGVCSENAGDQKAANKTGCNANHKNDSCEDIIKEVDLSREAFTNGRYSKEYNNSCSAETKVEDILEESTCSCDEEATEEDGCRREDSLINDEEYTSLAEKLTSLFRDICRDTRARNREELISKCQVGGKTHENVMKVNNAGKGESCPCNKTRISSEEEYNSSYAYDEVSHTSNVAERRDEGFGKDANDCNNDNDVRNEHHDLSNNLSFRAVTANPKSFRNIYSQKCDKNMCEKINISCNSEMNDEGLGKEINGSTYDEEYGVRSGQANRNRDEGKSNATEKTDNFSDCQSNANSHEENSTRGISDDESDNSTDVKMSDGEGGGDSNDDEEYDKRCRDILSNEKIKRMNFKVENSSTDEGKSNATEKTDNFSDCQSNANSQECCTRGTSDDDSDNSTDVKMSDGEGGGDSNDDEEYDKRCSDILSNEKIKRMNFKVENSSTDEGKSNATEKTDNFSDCQSNANSQECCTRGTSDDDSDNSTDVKMSDGEGGGDSNDDEEYDKRCSDILSNEKIKRMNFKVENSSTDEGKINATEKTDNFSDCQSKANSHEECCTRGTSDDDSDNSTDEKISDGEGGGDSNDDEVYDKRCRDIIRNEKIKRINCKVENSSTDEGDSSELDGESDMSTDEEGGYSWSGESESSSDEEINSLGTEESDNSSEEESCDESTDEISDDETNSLGTEESDKSSEEESHEDNTDQSSDEVSSNYGEENSDTVSCEENSDTVSCDENSDTVSCEEDTTNSEVSVGESDAGTDEGGSNESEDYSDDPELIDESLEEDKNTSYGEKIYSEWEDISPLSDEKRLKTRDITDDENSNNSACEERNNSTDPVTYYRDARKENVHSVNDGSSVIHENLYALLNYRSCKAIPHGSTEEENSVDCAKDCTSSETAKDLRRAENIRNERTPESCSEVNDESNGEESKSSDDTCGRAGLFDNLLGFLSHRRLSIEMTGQNTLLVSVTRLKWMPLKDYVRESVDGRHKKRVVANRKGNIITPHVRGNFRDRKLAEKRGRITKKNKVSVKNKAAEVSDTDEQMSDEKTEFQVKDSRGSKSRSKKGNKNIEQDSDIKENSESDEDYNEGDDEDSSEGAGEDNDMGNEDEEEAIEDEEDIGEEDSDEDFEEDGDEEDDEGDIGNVDEHEDEDNYREFLEKIENDEELVEEEEDEHFEVVEEGEEDEEEDIEGEEDEEEDIEEEEDEEEDIEEDIEEEENEEDVENVYAQGQNDNDSSEQNSENDNQRNTKTKSRTVTKKQVAKEQVRGKTNLKKSKKK